MTVSETILSSAETGSRTLFYIRYFGERNVGAQKTEGSIAAGELHRNCLKHHTTLYKRCKSRAASHPVLPLSLIPSLSSLYPPAPTRRSQRNAGTSHRERPQNCALHTVAPKKRNLDLSVGNVRMRSLHHASQRERENGRNFNSSYRPRPMLSPHAFPGMSPPSPCDWQEIR